MKKDVNKSKIKLRQKNSKGVIIFVIVFFLFLSFMFLFILGKIPGKIEKRSRLEGGLGSLGIFGDVEFELIDCSDESLRELWNNVFNEPFSGAVIVSDKDPESVCGNFVTYKILDGNEIFFIFGRYDILSSHTQLGINFIHSNLTENSINFIINLDKDSLGLISTLVFLLDIVMGNRVQGERYLENMNEANNEFLNIFKIENKSWAYGDGGYHFFEGGIGEDMDAVVLENITLDMLSYSVEILNPIDLTQIKDIEDLTLYGSKVHNSVLDLEEYFGNINYFLSDGNFTFNYKLSEPGAFNVFLNPFGRVEFDTSSGWDGNLTMNITLGYLDEENVTSNNFRVNVFKCVDPDGTSASLKKTVQNSTDSKTDSCVNSGSVREYYCGGLGEILSVSLNCVGNYSCSDGMCRSNNSINDAPEFLDDDCDYFYVEVNKKLMINMEDCFEDAEDDDLSFKYGGMSISYINITRNDTNLTFSAARNFVGRGYFYIYANDSISETASDKIYVRFRNSSSGGNNASSNGINQSGDSPQITGSSPPSSNVEIFSNENEEFSIDVTNYDNITWYLDNKLVKSGDKSYEVEDLDEGNYTIKVEVKKGSKTILKTWNLVVEKKSNSKIFLIMFFVVLGLAILIILFFIVKNLMNKRSDEPNTIVTGMSKSQPLYSKRLPPGFTNSGNGF